MLESPVDAPLGAEQQELVLFEICYDLGVRGEIERLEIDVGGDPADELVRRALHDDLDVIFILKAVFEDVELQHADNADDDLLHTGLGLMEDLDSALLRDLVHALDELLALHGILLADKGEVLGSKGRDALERELVSGSDDGVADGEHTGVEYADDIPGEGFVYDLALLSHDLLGLRELHLAVALPVVYVHVLIEPAGADAHERNAVAVGVIHISLYLEHEG